MVNTAFVTQSYADIHRKLQKLEGFAGMNATQLLEVANKVFVNQENEEKWEADKRMKAKMSLLAAALGKPDPSQLHHGSCQLHHGRGDWENPTPARPMCLLQGDWSLEK
jgi:hypothetical protein